MRAGPYRLAAPVGAIVLALSGCGTPTAAEPDAIVLGDAHEPGGFNPIAGYGAAGESKIYDGLLRLSAGPSGSGRAGPPDASAAGSGRPVAPEQSAPPGLPAFEPSLAAAMPVAEADATVWTVRLRGDDIRFTDGSAFDAADVVATYRAILDPASASEIRSSYAMIADVTAPDPATVRFTLRHPYAAFATKLLIGIVPAEAVATPGPAAESPLATAPVGTGPYRLAELRPDRAVLVANDDYRGPAPQVRKLTLLYVPDDNTRAQRMAAGELDGAALPPLLAGTFDGRDGLRVIAAPSADWRGVSLPSSGPVTGDPAVRRALNLAVDRQAIVAALLGGNGVPASTPFPPVYGDAHDPAAVFPFDRAAAAATLDAAGWLPGPDGVRARDGVRAAFTVLYNAADTLRRDLAQAFASDARRIGIEVDLAALSWDRIEPRVERDAILLGGGDEPYDPDTQAYETFHSSYRDPAAGSPYDNASRIADPVIDELLDRARRSTDPAERAAAYREVQAAHVRDPGSVFLVFLDHVYVARDTGWRMSEPVLEPHAHGVAWGPWWSLQTWSR